MDENINVMNNFSELYTAAVSLAYEAQQTICQLSFTRLHISV